MLHKKAAIFGLDARVALAIFTGLSILTVAGYQITITEAKGTQILKDLRSVIDAYRIFKLDTQSEISEYSANNYFYKISELVELTKDINKPYTVKYKGPYLNYKKGSTANFIIHPTTQNKVAIVNRRLNNWETADKTTKCPESNTDCFKWVVMYNSKCNLAEEIDLAVDGIVNSTQGSIRYEKNNQDCDIHFIIEPAY